MKTFFSVCLTLAGSCVLLCGAEFDVRDEAEFGKIVDRKAKLEKLGGDMGFLEGPVWNPADGGYLVFSDIPNNELKKWTKTGGLSTFRKPSNNANGNTLDLEGLLTTAEHSGRRVSVTGKDGTVRAVVDAFEGKKRHSLSMSVLGGSSREILKRWAASFKGRAGS